VVLDDAGSVSLELLDNFLDVSCDTIGALPGDFGALSLQFVSPASSLVSSEPPEPAKVMAHGLNGYTPALRNPAITFIGVTACNQACEKSCVKLNFVMILPGFF